MLIFNVKSPAIKQIIKGNLSAIGVSGRSSYSKMSTKLAFGFVLRNMPIFLL
jgi:hypothetical protein